MCKIFHFFLPTFLFGIGIMYRNECPQQPYIPIYLIVGGVFGFMMAVLYWFPCTQREEGDSNPDPPGCLYSTWTSLTKLFLFCWFIAGSIWICSIYEPDFVKNPASPELYCNKTLYQSALFYTIVGYSIMFVYLVHCLLPLCLSLWCPTVIYDNV
ncbi:transmembrane protein 272-like [Betta splendens]|uniref:Transmembrane protein 272-like n=1 Tax=Betta splendens TaxID=158456 RepID=A0A9W2XGJ1_BETSP|nr:transmembrane protein 272-like [Betta splendens]